MTAPSRLYRSLGAALLATQLVTACTSWQVQSTPLPERLQADPPSSIRLWLTDNRHMDLRNPRLVDDSVTGTNSATPAFGAATRGTKAETITVAAADITSYAERRTSGGRTVGLILFVGAVAAVIAVASLGDCCSLGGY